MMFRKRKRRRGNAADDLQATRVVLGGTCTSTFRELLKPTGQKCVLSLQEEVDEPGLIHYTHVYG